MSNEIEKLADEVAARLAEQVDALTPAERAVVQQRCLELAKPEQPAPDYANMSSGEFEAMKYKLMR